MPIKNLLLALAVFVALLAACGDDEADTDAEQPTSEAPADASDAGAGDEAADGAGGGFPVTIESAAGSFTLEARPERIVSLSPTATEMLFAIGAGDQVVAADEFSTYPPEAPVTDLSGFDPNVEAVLGFEPDLVVIANDANDLVAGLTAAGVPVLVSAAPVDIESGYPLIADLGVAVGRVDETADVIATMRDEMAAAFAAAPDAEVRIYHELDDTYFSASSFGFIGSIYAELGATNIADAGDPDRTGFPQLTEEAIVEADPEIIVITDEIGYTAADVAARPGWGDITAVVDDAIVSVDADIASRWGPRLPQFVTAVADAMAAAAAVPAG
ncbi:MAG: helical backbone metal receptor [Acidimicrobiales bacterium]